MGHVREFRIELDRQHVPMLSHKRSHDGAIVTCSGTDMNDPISRL